MCHLILLLPLIMLPVFWLMPAQLAVPVYILAGVTSGLTYWFVAKSMKKPVVTGTQALVGASAEVVSRIQRGKLDDFLVRAEGELWTARGTPSIQPGDRVTIQSVDGIKLAVSAMIDSEIMKEKAHNLDIRHCY